MQRPQSTDAERATLLARLCNNATLADAGLARHNNESRVGFPRGAETNELLIAADEWRSSHQLGNIRRQRSAPDRRLGRLTHQLGERFVRRG